MHVLHLHWLQCNCAQCRRLGPSCWDGQGANTEHKGLHSVLCSHRVTAAGRIPAARYTSAVQTQCWDVPWALRATGEVLAEERPPASHSYVSHKAQLRSASAHSCEIPCALSMKCTHISHPRGMGG